MHRCARGGKIYWIPVKVLISSKGGLPKKSNTNSIFHLLYPLPCRKYMIKHFPHFICFNSQSMSIPCNPSAGPHMPISVPDYPSAVLRLSDLLSLPPILIQDPAFCACPASHSCLPPLPSTLHVLQSLSLHTVLPFPPGPSSTLIQSPFCLLSTSFCKTSQLKLILILQISWKPKQCLRKPSI